MHGSTSAPRPHASPTSHASPLGLSPVLALTPFEVPDARVAIACARAGACAVLDLGRERVCAADVGADAWRVLVRRGLSSRSALRLPAGEPLWRLKRALVVGPAAAAWIGPDVDPAEARAAGAARVLVEVTDEAEAFRALATGADGLIARGAEAEGRHGAEGGFVLAQRLVAAAPEAAIWLHGGVGGHTAAAAWAAGLAGVVLSTPLALVRESATPETLRAAIARHEGTEVAQVGGHSVFDRPGLSGPRQQPGWDDGDPEAIASLGGADLDRHVVLAGMDAALAGPLAARHGHARAMVRHLLDAPRAHARQALRLAPLAPGSQLARRWGTRYPIAQGPMTRVSDRSAFAAEVASAGGMPFLALSLMPGDRARALLEETAERLGERPWGAGVLGFAPKALRDAQLDAIRAVRPPEVLIAGGRPSQARPLEADGIPTWLHVPSPGLLERFLDDGARRFVFEGRECGGHVGPRTSFVLWQRQIDTLLARDGALEDVEVLFAGGVHDARSAAMVATLSAPLAARGASVGVLMGTAYLFTHEAVQAGAILKDFQDAALACRDTELLETAPGHATRCARTPFVDQFEARRAELKAEGASRQAIWEALEAMNVGRLRIASKGLERQGDQLVEVDAERRKRDGMVMLGQVAALRDRVLSMAELHHDVSEGATRWLESLPLPAPAPAGPSEAASTPVAIVGMACVAPGSEDLAGFWSDVVHARDRVTEVPAQRWNPDIYYDPDGEPGVTTPSKWGGFLGDIPFQPLDYGIPPTSLASIEPVQLLALEISRRALEDAGMDPLDPRATFDRERVSVVFGAESGTDLAGGYGFRAMWPQLVGELPAGLDAHLPRPTEDSFPGVLANVVAGRVANRLDLGGVNYTVDAACASALAALDVAVKELATHTSDAVVCGGADLHNSIQDYLMFSSVHALGASGRCRTFDRDADGITLGESVVAVVLKRLDDAVADGDRIYAVVEGVAGSSDGRHLGLTAPRKDGQVRALERAYERAGLRPADVGLVEAHGTGTVVGDRTELRSLTQVYIEGGAVPGQAALGSVKSQVGHTKCAAGLLGLTKAALAIASRTLPPTLHVREPNPAWAPAGSPFQLSGRARPWLGDARAAGVSAFGFGGTNFHAVLAPPPEALARHAPAPVDMPCELILLRGATPAEAVATARQLRARLDDARPWRLAELASLTEATRPDADVQFATVVTTRSDLTAKLDALISAAGGAGALGWHRRAEDPAGREGKLAFLVPGQGSQRAGVLAELTSQFSDLLRPVVEHLAPWADLCFPPAPRDPREQRDQDAAVRDTRVAQPSLGVVSWAYATVLRHLGASADVMAGHSYGELAAVALAGGCDLGTLVDLSRARACAIVDAFEALGDDPGSMAAVRADAATVERALDAAGLRPAVGVANRNAEDQTVVAGPTGAISDAVAALEGAGLKTTPLRVACAFHHPLVADAATAFRRTLDHAQSEGRLQAATTPVASNVEGAWHAPDGTTTPELLSRQIAEPVAFDATVAALVTAGVSTVVEIGPGRVLSRLAESNAAGLGATLTAVPCHAPGDSELEALLTAVGALAVEGRVPDVGRLFTDRGLARRDLRDEPERAFTPTTWLIDGLRARPAVGEAPAHGLKPAPTEPLVAPGDLGVGGVSPEAEGREQVVLAYLDSMKRAVEMQREVVLGFLGAAAPPLPEAAPAEPAAASDVPPEAPPADEDVAAPAAETRDPETVLLDIVSRRTGYPLEMLDPDLDLEADLSIDSIKRLEIVAELGEALGLMSADDDTDEEARDALVEELAAVKTLRGILAKLAEQASGADAPEPGAAHTDASEPASLVTEPANGPRQVSDSPDAVAVPEVGRAEVTLERLPAPVPATEPLGPVALAPLGDGPLPRWCDALVEALEAAGLTVSQVADPEAAAASGARSWCLVAPDSSEPPAPCEAATAPLLPWAWAAAEAEAVVSRLTLLVDRGGTLGRADAGSGPSAASVRGAEGFLRALQREMSDRLAVQIVDVGALESPAARASAVAATLMADVAPGAPEEAVGLFPDGTRLALRARTTRALTAAEGPSAVGPKGSTWLLVGGARGITAHVAAGLASAVEAPRLVLVGRSARRDPADAPELDAATDLAGLRRALAERDVGRPIADIDREARAWMASREIDRTLERLAAAGAVAEYRGADVSDPAQVEALVEAVRADHGPIHGVVHAAGVLADRRIRDLGSDDLSRAWAPKVAGADHLAAFAVDEATRVFVGFGSVAGVFGNAGQAAYGAANDALDLVASELADAFPELRALMVSWGPWESSAGGMVDPALERVYRSRGIGLLPRDGAVEAFVNELRHAPVGLRRVVLAAGDPVSGFGPAHAAPSDEAARPGPEPGRTESTRAHA